MHAMMAPKEARTLLYTLLKADILQLQVCLLSHLLAAASLPVLDVLKVMLC